MLYIVTWCYVMLCNLILFTFILKGNVWVYSNYSKVQYTDSTATSTYCDKTTYLFTFWIITVSYIVTGVSLICGLLSICVCVLIAVFVW